MKKHVHFLGIGGVSMCGLAALAAANGAYVTGSDNRENRETARLVAAGIPVTIGTDTASAALADLLVYTAAVAPDHPERVTARAGGVPTLSRAAYLGREMRAYPVRIGVAGTHGKSTVTGMLAAIFAAAKQDATVLCGAPLSAQEPPYRIGGKELLLFEACEYKDSFLAFTPTIAVLNNLEWEHVDYFRTEAQMQESFRMYATSAKTVIANAEDACLAAALGDMRRITFGRSHGDHTLRDGVWYAYGVPQGEISLSVLGTHNLQNALAAAATAHTIGIPADTICTALADFRGVERRMTFRGTLPCGARVYDDYAHHPTEVAASLSAARATCRGRLICAFQSHTYSRTAAFLVAFQDVFAATDVLYTLPIYAARETNTFGVSAADIVAAHPMGAVCADATTLAAALMTCARPDDVVLLMGAGDIDSTLLHLPLSEF